MSDDEDDYLSDKFLAQLEAASKPSQPKSYTERRKQALKQSQLLEKQNRKKSRKQVEVEAREEGLQTSLIEKAQEEAQETGKQNKALAIMMKMGFKPGQSLGESHEENSSPSSTGGNLGSARTTETPGVVGERDAEAETPTPPPESRTSAFAAYKHRAEPVSIKEWSGTPRSSSANDLIDPRHAPPIPFARVHLCHELSSVDRRRQDRYRWSKTTPIPERARTCGQNGQAVRSPQRRRVPGPCAEGIRGSKSGRQTETCEDHLFQSRREG